MQLHKQRRRRMYTLLAATLAGGTLMGTCQTRVRDSFFGGARALVSQLLDPTVLLPELFTPNDTANTIP